MFDSVLKLSLLKHHLQANRLFDITKKIKANWEYFDVNFNEGFLRNGKKWRLRKWWNTKSEMMLSKPFEWRKQNLYLLSQLRILWVISSVSERNSSPFRFSLATLGTPKGFIWTSYEQRKLFIQVTIFTPWAPWFLWRAVNTLVIINDS